MHEYMENLEKVKSIVITTNDLVNKVANILSDYYRNIIFINKLKMLVKYHNISIQIGDKEYFIDYGSSKIDVANMNKLINKADRLSITPENGNATLVYSKEEIKSVYGVNLLCHKELSLEYFKTIVYDMLYRDSELLYLCRKNPGMKDDDAIDMVNVLEILDVTPSHCLSASEIADITAVVRKELKEDYGIYLKNISTAIAGYSKNPKTIKVTGRAILIDIYTDIRVVRFYEATNHMRRSDMENDDEAIYNNG